MVPSLIILIASECFSALVNLKMRYKHLSSPTKSLVSPASIEHLTPGPGCTTGYCNKEINNGVCDEEVRSPKHIKLITNRKIKAVS